MNFTTGRTYQFKVKVRGRPEHYGFSRSKDFKVTYIRHVGKLELFKSPAAGWLESFTRAQLADFQITEVRK